MGNDLTVADEGYITRVLLTLEDFLFFSLYSFPCIVKQDPILKHLRLLSCSDPFETNLESLVLFPDIKSLSTVSATSDAFHYTRKSHTTTYLILNVPTSFDWV